MRIRTTIGPADVGATVIRARCHVCGEGFAVLTEHPRAAVDHRCPVGVVGPVWVLIQPASHSAVAA